MHSVEGNGNRDSDCGASRKRIALLVCDFDGVMTDNRVLVDETGREAVWCNRADGLGVARLKKQGIHVLVLSTETSKVVAARCGKLGVECIHGCDDKLTTLREFAERREIPRERIAYLGNDINDLECMRWVGLPLAVADAYEQVLSVARFVTQRKGGDGAVREIADWILSGIRGRS